jgi:hypothetical protein
MPRPLFEGVRTVFTENGIVHVLHPPYSPYLALSDFWLFGHVKAALAGQAFDRPVKLLDAITTFLEEIHVSELKGVFQHWVERVQLVLSHNGDSYHE